MQPNHFFALIIAASEYDDTRLQQLRSPAADARAKEEVLHDPQIGDYQIDSLLNQPSYNVNEAIEEFFADRSRGDQLLLYFSCHGIKDDRGRLYFAASNTKLNRLASTGISSEFVAEQMYECAARRIILVLDCCYSGAFKRGLRPRAGESVSIDSFAGRGRAILFASNAMEYSFEMDGSAIEGAGIPSLFTRTVVHALRTGEADLDGDGLVSVDELYDYVRDQLREIAPRQTPGKLIDTEGVIYIARSTKSISGLGVLQKEIRTALSSPLAGVRKGVIEELQPLLISNDEPVRLAAQAALIQLSTDESDRVAGAAATVLGIDTATQETPNLRGDEVGSIAPVHARAESTRAGHKRSEDYTLVPGLGTGPTNLAEWVENIKFSVTRLRPGYEQKDVDDFLDQVQATFLGQRIPPLTAHDVRNVQFNTSRTRPGYDEEEVDAFLDKVELVLESRATPV